MLFYLMNRWLIGESEERVRAQALEQRLRDQEKRSEELQASFSAFRTRETAYLNKVRDRMNLVSQNQQALARHLLGLRQRQEELSRETGRPTGSREPVPQVPKRLAVFDKRLARLGHHLDRLTDRLDEIDCRQGAADSRRPSPAPVPSFLRRGSANPAKQNEALANIFRLNLELQKGISRDAALAETRKMA